MKSFFMKLGALASAIFVLLEILGGIAVGLGGLRVLDTGHVNLVVFSPRPEQEFIGNTEVITVPVKIDTNSVQQNFRILDANGTQIYSGQPQNGLLYITDPKTLGWLSGKGFLDLNLKVDIATGEDEFNVNSVGRVSAESLFTSTPPIPFRVILQSKIAGFIYPEFASGRDGSVTINVDSKSNHLTLWYGVKSNGQNGFLDYQDTAIKTVSPQTKTTSLEMRIPAFIQKDSKTHPVAGDKIHLAGGIVDGAGTEMLFEINLIASGNGRNLRFVTLSGAPNFGRNSLRPDNLPDFEKLQFSATWQAPRSGELDVMGIAEMIITSILFGVAILILHKIFSLVRR